MTKAALIDAVRTRFGPKTAITDPADIAPWLTDWRGRWHGTSAAILSPASTEEVAAIVTLAAEHRVAGAAELLPNPPAAACDIAARFALTLGSRGSCTIGGLVSTNAGGTQVLRFGTMRGLIAGVEGVWPDGSVHDGLAALKKDNRGPSLDQLLIGAEGTLGIVTAAALRLVPAVYDRAVAWVGLASPHAALALLRGFQAQTDRIEGFEIIPGDTLALVLAHIPGARAPLANSLPWHLLIEATAASPTDEPSVALVERLLSPALEERLIGDATIAASEAQAEAFWHLRDSISEAERCAGPAVQHDISVPVDAMPDFMMAAAATVERAYPGTHATAFGHLGDGNVHFHVRAPAAATADWPETSGKSASRLVHDLVVAAGGSISAEHGIGQMKKDELARLGPPARLLALRAIKAALDPLGIMNPGKLID
ncbi:MAG: FAD-binding oxidoreductase [Sphingomicrobium sp.]